MKDKLKEFSEDFDPRLKNFLETQLQRPEFSPPSTQELLKEINELVLNGGKRLRPALIYNSFLLRESEPTRDVYYLGIATEIFHAYGLIHDDIIDHSMTRRNRPSIQSIYQEKYKDTDFDAYHEGLTAAILAGDLAHLLSNNAFDKIEAEQRLVKLFRLMQSEVHSGQIDDCLGIGSSDLNSLDRDRILKMLSLKSGQYSIQKPMMMGLALADGTAEELSVLDEVGKLLGLVFQIKDDLLGVFGDVDKMGKSNLSDLAEGKRTLIVHDLYQKLDFEDKWQFSEILGNSKISEQDRLWVIEKCEKFEIKNNLELEIKGYQEKAVQMLKQNFEPSEGLSFILELAEFLLEREK